MIDILNIQPSVISRDLRGKYVLLYGKPKSGKTTAACSFPRSLLLAFEKGYNAIGGVKAADMTKWSDLKLVMRQLNTPQAKEMYETIIIDTVTIAFQACEDYICAQNGVQKINEVPWGGGYTALKKEFESTLRQITQMGYGLVLICHNSTRIEKTADGSDVEIISPELPKRAAEICNGLVDIIGYIGNEWVNGESKRWLYTRETPTLFAGSRYKYLAAKIPFGYQSLVDAVADAIEMEQKNDGITVVDHVEVKHQEALDYDKVRAEAMEIWTKMVTDGGERAEDNAKRILARAEKIFGRQIKLSEITENQVDLFALLVLEMKDLMNK